MPEAKLKIRWTEQVECIRRVEFDTAEEGMMLAGALGGLAVANSESNPQFANKAKFLQRSLLNLMNQPSLGGPFKFEIDDQSRTRVIGSLIQGGEVTDLESQVLLFAAEACIPDYSVEITRK